MRYLEMSKPSSCRPNSNLSEIYSLEIGSLFCMEDVFRWIQGGRSSFLDDMGAAACYMSRARGTYAILCATRSRQLTYSRPCSPMLQFDARE